MRPSYHKQTPIGVYLSDSLDIYNNGVGLKAKLSETYQGYLPVVSLFTANANGEICFTDTRDKTQEISTYNRCVSNKNLDAATIRAKRIDTTHNDLSLGPSRFILNFTNYTVTTNLSGEYRKMYPKIVQDQFSDHVGKVMIFSVFTLNTPTFVQAATGVNNYLENMCHNLQHRPGIEVEQMREIYGFAERMWPLFRQQPNGTIANSIKVICLQEIDERTLLDCDDRQMYLPNLGLTIGFTDILEIHENPGTQFSGAGGQDLAAVIRSNSFICYIVDNNDYLGDRFINVAGVVRKIEKIKDPALVNGLYFIHTGADKKPHLEVVSSLEEIDKNEFVYRSIEEANQGANVRQRYRDELETARNKLEHDKIEATAESLRLKGVYEVALAQLRQTLEQTKLESEKKAQEYRLALEQHKILSGEKKLQQENSKSDLDAQREALKFEYDLYRHRMDRMSLKNKYDFEERKYDRDSTIETLKAVGAIAGIAATGFLIYKKLAD